MVEIACPRCDEPNNFHVEDFAASLQPTGNGTQVKTKIFCNYCDALLTLVIALRVSREN